MKMLKKFRYSIMAIVLAGTLVVPVVAQAAAWICVCEITKDYGICVCVFDAES